MSTHDRGRPPRTGRRGTAAPVTRLRFYRNPLHQAVSGSTWRAAGFLAGYVFLAGWLLFAIAFTATVTAAVFLITLAGIPLLVARPECCAAAPAPSAPGCGRCWPPPSAAATAR